MKLFRFIGRKNRLSMAALAAVVGMLNMGAFAGSSGASVKSSSSSCSTVLTVWDPLWNTGSNWYKVMGNFDKDFEKAYCVTIKHESVPAAPAQYTALLQTALEGGNAPDVALMLPGGHGVFNFLKAILPLDAVAKPLHNKYVGWDATTTGGHVYGIPMGIEGMVWVYNKTLFAKAGLNPNSPPTTYAGLIAASKKLQAAGIQPMIGGQSDALDVPWIFDLLFPSVATTADVTALSDGHLKFASPKVEEALTKTVDLVKMGLFPKDFLSVGLGDSITNFAAGQGAIVPCIVSCMAAFIGSKVGNNNVGIIPLVGINGSKTNFYPAGGNLSWSVFKSSKNQGLATDYVKYMSSVAVQRKLYLTQGWAPSNKGIALPAAQLPAEQKLLADIQSASATQILTTNNFPAPVEAEFDAQVQLVVSGSETVDAAMKNVDTVVASQSS